MHGPASEAGLSEREATFSKLLTLVSRTPPCSRKAARPQLRPLLTATLRPACRTLPSSRRRSPTLGSGLRPQCCGSMAPSCPCCPAESSGTP